MFDRADENKVVFTVVDDDTEVGGDELEQQRNLGGETGVEQDRVACLCDLVHGAGLAVPHHRTDELLGQRRIEHRIAATSRFAAPLRLGIDSNTLCLTLLRP